MLHAAVKKKVLRIKNAMRPLAGDKTERFAFPAWLRACLLMALIGGSDASLAQVITPAMVTASSYYSAAQSPTNLVNSSGQVGNYILAMTANADSGANGMWHSDGGRVAGTWVAFDLGQRYALTRADIWQMNQNASNDTLGRGVKDFAIYTSSDGDVADATNYVGNFSLAIGTGSNGEPVQRLTFPATITGVRLVKCVIIDDWNGYTNDYVGLAEVRFESSQVFTPASVTAVSYYSTDQIPNNLINGSGLLGNGPVLTRTCDNNPNGEGMWHSSRGLVNGSWVAFDLGAPHTLTGADIWQLNQAGNLGRGVKSFGIYTSPNLSDPITNFAGGFTLKMASGTTNEASQFVPFFAANARRVMFVISNDWNGWTSDFVGLSEVRLEGSLIDFPITNGLFGYWKFDDAGGSIADDSSGNGNFGTIHNSTGGMGQWVKGMVGGALHFRGAGFGADYVAIPNLPDSMSNGMTLSAWVRADTGQDGALVGVVENSAQTFILAQDNTPLPQALWHHVVMVTAGGNISVYRDGMLVAAGSYDNTLFHVPDTLVLGARINDSSALESYWQGDLDEVACWTRALQSDDVFKVFAAGQSGVDVMQSDSFSNSPPVIINGAQGGIVYAYEPLSLAINAAGIEPLHYQWFKDGVPIAGSDYQAYNNPRAGFDAAGQYVVVATAGNGQSATSQPITVIIGLPELTVAPVTNGVNISWPATALDYQLEFASSLNGPWSIVPYSITNSLVLPATNSACFYRLKNAER